MSSHPFLDDELSARAALHAVGALSEDEARHHRLHLLECATCRTEAEALARVVGPLALAGPQLRPGPGLFERILERIHAPAPEPASSADEIQVWKRWSRGAGTIERNPLHAGLTLVRGGAGQGAFEPTGIVGIDVRKLFVDEAHDRATMLVRMAPGTAYPAHRHGGDEECFVLEGELKVGKLEMRAGDYQRADAGSVHEPQVTETGCLLLIVSSLHDEML